MGDQRISHSSSRGSIDADRLPCLFFLRRTVYAHNIYAVPFMTAGALIGCGGQAVVVESAVPATSEHHGGILIPLTDKHAYMELLNGDRLKKGDEHETTLVAYLIQSDQKSAISETPTSAGVTIATPEGGKMVAPPRRGRIRPFDRRAGPLASFRHPVLLSLPSLVVK